MTTGTPATRRLFIGLMAPMSVSAQIADHRVQWTWPASAKLTPVENFHLTLAFLGQVDADAESALRAGLGAVRFSPFELWLDRPGRFPAAGIAFVAPRPDESLAGLHAAIGAVVERCGVAVRGDWHPHVTLARKAGAATAPGNDPGMAWPVDRFSLVLSAAGRYQPIETWPAAPWRSPDCAPTK